MQEWGKIPAPDARLGRSASAAAPPSAVRDRRPHARPYRSHQAPRPGARADRRLCRRSAPRARRRAAAFLLSLRALVRRDAPGGDRRRLALRRRYERRAAPWGGDRPLRHAQARGVPLEDAVALQDAGLFMTRPLITRPITAIIVTYQSARTIREALAAARRCHDAGLLELVVVDNA